MRRLVVNSTEGRAGGWLGKIDPSRGFLLVAVMSVVFLACVCAGRVTWLCFHTLPSNVVIQKLYHTFVQRCLMFHAVCRCQEKLVKVFKPILSSKHLELICST